MSSIPSLRTISTYELHNLLERIFRRWLCGKHLWSTNHVAFELFWKMPIHFDVLIRLWAMLMADCLNRVS